MDKRLSDKPTESQSYFLDFPESNTQLQWVHWLMGTIFLILLIIVGTIPLLLIDFIFPLDWQIDVNPDFPRSGYADSIFLWVSFLPAFIAPFLIYKFWHHLPFKRLLTINERFRWSRLWVSISVVLFAYSAISLIDYWLDPTEYKDVIVHPDIKGFAIMLGVMLIFLPIQSASEEILCRGYLNQGLSLITKRPWIAFIITSAFFALLHLANPEADGQVWPYMVGTFVFGMAMCWLSYEDQGLESAIGLHIGNNFFVFVLFGYADPTLPQSALLMGPEPVIDWQDTIESAVVILIVAFAVIHINRYLTRRAHKKAQALHANA